MRVSAILINTGQQSMEVGFQNPRLPPNVGPYNVGDGQRFGYGVQVTFILDGIDPLDTTPKRSVIHKTHWHDPLEERLRRGRGYVAPPPENIRNAQPTSNDDPNAQNVKRDGNRIIVFDGPGPSNPIVLGGNQYYPIRFEGRFKLTLVHNHSRLTIASAEFYLDIQKATKNGKVAGTFTALSLAKATLRTHVVQVGGVTSPPTFSISEWASNQGHMTLR